MLCTGTLAQDVQNQPQAKSSQETAPEVAPKAQQVIEVTLPPAFIGITEQLSAAIAAIGAQRDSSEKEKREKADLRAQMDMAKWAFWMVVSSFAAVIVTAFGVWLIKRTLEETNRAANYTQGMLIESEKTTKAALMAAETARQEFIATHRPRISVRSIQIPNWFADHQAHVLLTVVNVGDTPATIIELGGDMALREGYKWLAPGLNAALEEIPPITLKSGERATFTVYSTAKMSGDILNMIYFDGVTRMYLVGEIKYTDALGTVRHTGFMREYRPRDPERFVVSKTPEIIEYEYED